MWMMIIRRLYQATAAGLKVAQQPEAPDRKASHFFSRGSFSSWGGLTTTHWAASEARTNIVSASMLTQRVCKSTITALCCCFSLLCRPWISLVSICLRSTWVLASPVSCYPVSALPSLLRRALLVEARVAWISSSSLSAASPASLKLSSRWKLTFVH